MDAKLEVTILGDTVEILSMLEINEDNLSAEYTRQAALFAWVAAEAAAAERDHANAAVNKDTTYAELDFKCREWASNNGQKTTEAEIKAMIQADDSYIAAVSTLNDAEYVMNIMKALVQAMRIRADMLVSLGANMRQEMGMTGMTMQQHTMEKAVRDVRNAVGKR